MEWLNHHHRTPDRHGTRSSFSFGKSDLLQVDIQFVPFACHSTRFLFGGINGLLKFMYMLEGAIYIEHANKFLIRPYIYVELANGMLQSVHVTIVIVLTKISPNRPSAHSAMVLLIQSS